MRKILAAMLCAAIVLSTAGCSGVKTKDEVKPPPAPEAKTETTTATPPPAKGGSNGVNLQLLAMSSNEKEANVVRDQLAKAGFTVKMNIQPDYSSYQAQEEAGNFDIDISSWTTVTGNPDYAVKSLFKTGGDYNKSPVNNPEIDALIQKAGTEAPEEYKKTYTEFEKKLVDENAYIVPLFAGMKTQAINKEVLNVDSVRLSKSRSLPWEELQFVDTAKNETDPFIMSQTLSTLTSMDPIKGNDGSINILNTNLYVRLVNLTDDDQVTSKGSLSLNHAIADGNREYYFILRDDINFSNVKDKHAVDSGERVGAEDVVFSMERAKNKDSVPDHRTYTLHESMEKAEIVTDLAALEAVKASGTGETIKAALEKDLAAPIASLEADKTAADNKAGKYQVVKITTKEPFPQVLNYLAHQSAGIVSKKAVEAINTFDVANYNRDTDICYGDQSTVSEGSSYNNTLACSGPYIMIQKNDYEVTFEKNPAYMAADPTHSPKIKNITVKFIKDLDSSLSALRSGETHILYSVPENKWDIVENDPKFNLQKGPSNGVSYMFFNMREGSQCQNVTLRKSILAAINQDDIIAVFEGKKLPAYSTLSTMVDTGNKLVYEAGKSQQLVDAYLAEAK